jgi:ribose transport system substrate-binding protein
MRFVSTRLWAAGVAAAALVFAAGCGSNQGSSGGSGTGQASSAQSNQIVNECRQRIERASQPLDFSAPGPEFDASKLAGKRVMFVSLAQAVPAIAQVATATQQAGKVAGVKVDIFDTKGDVRLMQQAIQQAVAQKYDAIILLGIPLKVTQPALKAAKDAGIPIVSELNNEPKPGAAGQGAGDTVFGTTGPPRFATGQLLACKAVVDTNGKANAVIFGAKDLEPSADEVRGMRDILGRCSGCKVSENSTPTAEWQTKLPSLAASEVRRNPNANYFLPLYDGMGIFVTSGIQQAGAAGRVKVASFNAAPAALELIRKGDTFTADPGQPNSWMAWQGLDQAMRGMLDMKPGHPVVPVRYFDRTNIKGLDVHNEDALFGSEYRQGFTQLWGAN